MTAENPSSSQIKRHSESVCKAVENNYKLSFFIQSLDITLSLMQKSIGICKET
jgi:hypothetical protein